jgi:hypothetical protein
LIENFNISVYANITNIGLSPITESFIVGFFFNDPLSGGFQIGENITVYGLDSGQTAALNTTFLLRPGINNIYVQIDGNSFINETIEDNNIANNSVSVDLYHYFYGNITANLILAGNGIGPFISFTNMTSFYGHIFVADSDSDFSFYDLQALSRNINNDSVNNDFSDIDTNLNSTGLADSLSGIWANGTNTPLIVGNISLASKTITYIPFINSTNSSPFITGILWDTSDDTLNNYQYDVSDKEDIVFVTPIGQPKQGSFGIYYYELRVPATLRSYKGTTDNLAFYYELE